MKTCYDNNDTMKMIGKQKLSNFGKVEDIFNAVDDIAKARPFSLTHEAAMDVFLLGYIYGKRAERSKKMKQLNIKKEGTRT